MNMRSILFSIALTLFGLMVIFGTMFYAVTGGFTRPIQWYTTTTYTVGIGQGLVVVAGPSTSTITSKSLPGVTFIITDVIFVPTVSSSLSFFYVLGIVFIGIALVLPIYLASARAGKVKRIQKSGLQSSYCINCGSRLLPEAQFCNKCGAKQ